MRIMIGIGHPKQVHIRKNIVRNLIEDGHEVKILAIDKDITLYLLNVYGLDYDVFGRHQKGMVKKACDFISCTYRAFAIAKRFRPDILVAGNPYLAYVSKMLGKPHIMLTDTEHANLTYWLTYPFTEVVCTPSCFKRKINPKKHVVYNGYGELTYLHPNYFKPDLSVIDKLGISRADNFTILRLGSWSATHDAHSSGIKLGSELIFVKSLEQYGRVFITSERALPIALQKYRLNIRPENIHSVLSLAQLYIGEGETMAVESAILGTPAIDIEAITLKHGTVDITAIHGNADELVNKYRLMFAFADQNQALEKAIELLEDNQSKKKWMKRREKLLRDKIDVTAFMTDFIENYPESFHEYYKNRGAENI